MNTEAMVRQSVSKQVQTPNLLIVPVDNHTIDVFNEHDYRDWSRYGFHKSRWHFQKGNRLSFQLFKEMADGISQKN